MSFIKTLIVDNPYRTLDLFSNASYKEQIIQCEKLELAVEFKKDKPSAINAIFNFINEPLKPRSLESINQANHELEQDRDRLFHSFFWFTKIDEIDKQSIDSLEQFNYAFALELWEKALATENKCNWQINFKLTQFLIGKMSELELFKTIIDMIENRFEDYCELYQFKLPHLESFKKNILKTLVDKVLKQTTINKLELIKVLPNSSSLKKTIEAGVLGAVQDEIYDLCEKNKQLLNNNLFWADLNYFEKLNLKTEELKILHLHFSYDLSLGRAVDEYVDNMLKIIKTYDGGGEVQGKISQFIERLIDLTQTKKEELLKEQNRIKSIQLLLLKEAYVNEQITSIQKPTMVRNTRNIEDNPLEKTKKNAEQGDAAAQCNLAILYEDGLGIQKNIKQAVYWYTKSAKQGNAKAQFHLGYLYERGVGVEKDIQQASHWYKQAFSGYQKLAKENDAEAQRYIGVIYQYGYGVPEDIEKAIYWLKKSAEQGDAEAQYGLGHIYVCGIVVEKDIQQAFYWYKKAFSVYQKLAKEGDSNAQRYTGVIYQNGYGVPKDIKKAIYWLKKSAEQGNVDAQFNLGSIYEFGGDVEKDAEEAIYWYQQAADQGDDWAQANINSLKRRNIWKILGGVLFFILFILFILIVF